MSDLFPVEVNTWSVEYDIREARATYQHARTNTQETLLYLVEKIEKLEEAVAALQQDGES